MSTTINQRYQFTVAGHLDDHWTGRLGDLILTRHDDGTTTLAGTVVDQAQLHGVLAGIRDIGATLLSVNALEPKDPRPPLQQPVRTERLILRPATSGDAEPTWAYRRLESVARWLTHLPVDLATYRATFTDPARLATTIVVERNGHLIGDLMLRVENAWAQSEVADRARDTQAELGWVLDPAYTGHGYATEAARAMLRICFEDLGVRRVVASCFADNAASWRLMERLGMRREAHAISESLHRSGQWLDTLTYAILAPEWKPEA
jgi:RimJ/RimL family protein N-acetyltransferase